MIYEHFKTGFRHLLKDKFYTALNFSGLCLGLLLAMFIVTWIIEELNYDKHFTDSDKIYRVERDFSYNGRACEMPATSFNYAKALEHTFPDIEASTKMYPFNIFLLTQNEIYKKEKVHFADSNFFEIFNFQFLSGNPFNALDNLNSVVLTKQSAQSFFGKVNVLGETIKVKVEDLEYNLKITGIIKEVPQNTHFHPDVIIPLPLLKDYYKSLYNEWRANIGYTYIKINNNKNLAHIKSKLPEFLLQHAGPAYHTILQDNDDINDAIRLKLKNIEDIHLKSHLECELETNGDIRNIYLLASVALLIILLAVSNYINLANARSEIRSLEVGIRKVVGSSKLQLAFHFFLESFMMMLFAFVVSIILLFLLSPIYENLSGQEFRWIFFDSYLYFSLLLGSFFAVSLLAGLYPAIIISRFKILKSLKGKRQANNTNFSTKAALVVFQFFISIGLITFSLLVSLQINLIYKKDIGFDQNNLLVIDVNSPSLRNHFDSFKEQLLNVNGIKKVTSAGVVPVNQIYPSFTVQNPSSGQDIFLAYLGVNYDYIETFQIDLVAGRFFSRNFADSSCSRYVINEKTSRLLGFTNPEEAIGQQIKTKSHLVSTYDKAEIIGVVKDFNFKSLHEEIEPAGIQLLPEYLNAIFIRMNTTDQKTTIKEIKSLWKSRFPESEFNYSFLSDTILDQYRSEKGLQTKLVICTFLAVIIGCIGLFGLSVYILQQQTKEIGMRKVNGATSKMLIILFSKQYLNWIAISALFAFPVTYYLFRSWLTNFAIKIDFHYFWIVFILAWFIVIVISIVTIIGQTIKFSKLNPVDLLRDE